MAEGPVIQKGHERPANGMTLRKVLSTVAEFRQQNTQTPVVMMGYANPMNVSVMRLQMPVLKRVSTV